MNSKDRAALRSAANKLETIFQIGKSGIGDSTAGEVDAALRARELIKLRVLDSCPLSAREAADELAAKTGSETVQVIGSRFVLYKRNKDINGYGI